MNYFILWREVSNKLTGDSKLEKLQKTQESQKDIHIGKSKGVVDLKDFRFISGMLKNLPKDIWDIFIPKSSDETTALEMNIVRFEKRQKEREQIIEIQKSFKMLFRPNASMREVGIQTRIQLLKRERAEKRGSFDKDFPEDQGDSKLT